METLVDQILTGGFRTLISDLTDRKRLFISHCWILSKYYDNVGNIVIPVEVTESHGSQNTL